MTKNTPKYYIGKYKNIEAMDVVLDFQEDSYNIGVAIAYLLRAGKKEGNPVTQDIEKAIVHLKIELEHLIENGGINSNDIQGYQGHSVATPYHYTNSTGSYQEWQEQILNREGPWDTQR
tara:strand:- start:3860 stop:4216 length:357 start_codon:yes stop_codon:yes gene_type:complete